LTATAVTLSPRGRGKRKDNLPGYLYVHVPIYLTQTRFSVKMLIIRILSGPLENCNIILFFSSTIMSGKISEKILLYQLYTKQNPEAFAKLYDLYATRIYRFVFFKVANREEAEDITSEVFLKAWNYVGEKKKIESFSGLLYKLARNSVIDLYRSKTRQTETLSYDGDEEGLDVGDNGKWESALGNKLETQKIIQGLQKLKQEYREVVTLRYVEELEISEIAEIMSKGQMAVRVTLHRGLKKLKEFLKE
jgi:RNA polymerase sigma-70 factor, ECF subfamily